MDRQFGGISGEVVNPRGCTKTLGEASAVKKPLPVEAKIMKAQPSELETVHQFFICKNRLSQNARTPKRTAAYIAAQTGQRHKRNYEPIGTR